MNIFSSNKWWKALLIAALFVFVAGSILYSNYLAKKLAKEEKKKIELIANVYKRLGTTSENLDIGFMFEIISSNETVPLILTDDEGNVMAYKNIDSSRAVKDTSYLRSMVKEMAKEKPPIPIEYSESSKNYIYYRDSYLLTQLIYFPYITFGTIIVFLIIAYVVFSTARRSEQNRLWVGMAKETAHQLGTPLTSLSAWVDYVENQLQESEKEKVIPEMHKDIYRLNLIAERFSKIGSVPVLQKVSMWEVVEKNISYIRRRTSEKVEFTVHGSKEHPVYANISPPLFDWVLENLMKNALDAMTGEGKIDVYLSESGNRTIIDVKDSGKGIPASKFKTVFEPGYSTKTRGWGLGLSLSKRIIQNYHSGKIFVKESVAGKGTTFRIVLNNA